MVEFDELHLVHLNEFLMLHLSTLNHYKSYCLIAIRKHGDKIMEFMGMKPTSTPLTHLSYLMKDLILFLSSNYIEI